MKEKKIIYIHTGEWPSRSPSTVFVTGTVYGLAQNVSTVLIIRNNSKKSSQEIFHSLTGTDISERLEIVRIGYGGKTPGHTGFFKQALKYTGTLAKNGEAGAVITRSIGFLPYLAYLRKRYSLPCYFETHDFYGDLKLRSDLKKTLRIRRNHLYEKIFFPRIDGLICLTNSQKEMFQLSCPSTPATVAHSGLLKVERRDTKREKLVCYVGSLDEHKGLGTVLSALSQTADKEIKLLVIGGKNEHEMREFRDFAHLIGVKDRVRITGWIHHSDIGYMMDRCIAGVVPLSDTPFNRYITSPLKILDCFSRSLPVIGSDLPPIREYVEDGKHGIIFTPDSPENLAEALDRFVAGNMFKTMSPEVEKKAARFLYKIRGKKIFNFINETFESGLDRPE